jgi:hypothetical protein
MRRVGVIRKQLEHRVIVNWCFAHNRMQIALPIGNGQSVALCTLVSQIGINQGALCTGESSGKCGSNFNKDVRDYKEQN